MTSTTTTHDPGSIVADGHRLIRLPVVLDITGLSRSALYRHEVAGSFPAAIRIAPRAKAYRLDEVKSWVERRATKHRCVQDVGDGGAG